ncbi:MAG: Gfo/Idh/MocA family oxidoreductase [Kiritimatiellia bacterium]
MEKPTVFPPPGRVGRRQFLKHAAATGTVFAVPSIVPAATLGRGGAVAPSERIVMGAIGVGGRGGHDLHWLMDEPDVQFAAVCDVKRSQREAAKAAVDGKNGNADCAMYRDLRELLAERTDLDAVLIATGDRWHAPASILAMQAGKDVYCEKPSCFTMEQGRKVVDTAKRYGRVFQTGTQRLSEANHVFGMEMARLGRLGKIHTVYADIRYRGGSRRDWLPAQPEPPREELDWDAWLGPAPWRPYNGGYLGGGWYNHYDFATDVAQWGAHTIAQSLAGIEVPNPGTIQIEFDPASPNLAVRFTNGIKMILIRGSDPWTPNSYWHGSCGERFDGEDGWAAAADGYTRPDVSSPVLLTDQKRILAEYTARTGRPMSHVRDFLDCVKTRRQTVAHPEIMRNSMAICLASDICSLLKRNLTFDPVTAEFIGDPEANRFRSRAMRMPWCV